MSVKRGSLGEREMRIAKRDPTIFDARIVSRGDVVRSVLRDDHQVSMGNAVTVHHHANAFGLEAGAHPSTDSLRNNHHVRRDGVVNIGEVVDVLPWDDRAFAGSERP
jgi:hypothetical protein